MVEQTRVRGIGSANDGQTLRPDSAAPAGNYKRLAAASLVVALGASALLCAGWWQQSYHRAAVSPRTGVQAFEGFSTGSAESYVPAMYFEVGSQAQAEQVEADWAEGVATAGNGVQIPPHMTVVVTTPAEEQRLLDAVGDAGSMSAAAGTLGPRIVDLRQEANGPKTPGEAETSYRGDGYSVYLVSSPEQAAALAAQQHSTNSMIAVADSPKSLEAAQRAAAEIDNAQIVDLRAP